MRKNRFDDIDDVGIDWWQLAIVAMFILMAAGILTSCKTKTQIVTVPEYHKEYIVRSDTVARVDSVLLHDSVFVYNVGDTIVVNKVMYRDRVRNVYKTRTDTILKTDSVRVPYPVEQTGRQYAISGKTLVLLGSFLLIVPAVVIVWLARRKAKK